MAAPKAGRKPLFTLAESGVRLRGRFAGGYAALAANHVHPKSSRFNDIDPEAPIYFGGLRSAALSTLPRSR
ncbi:MAG: hypothetical protein WCA16_10085 [Candidatus Sulfotelmatobacter sp.]